MNEMAAEVADGILVMPFNSGQHMTERTMPAIERGLAAAGRTRDDIEIIVEVIVGVGRNDEELERPRGVRNLLAFYGSTPAYKPVLDVEGWGDLQPELNALSKQGDWATMATLITDEMVQHHRGARHARPGRGGDRARATAPLDRVCAYFPFYQAGDDLHRRLHRRPAIRHALAPHRSCVKVAALCRHFTHVFAGGGDGLDHLDAGRAGAEHRGDAGVVEDARCRVRARCRRRRPRRVRPRRAARRRPGVRW